MPPIGTPLTLYGIGIDVTARKRAEAALREAKEAAESANQLKDQFLATLSHELRTPLNAILGYARMLQTNAIAPEKRPRAIDIIERNAAAQNQLIEDLLDISRITRGQVRLEPAPTSIDAVLREAVEGVRPAADAKRIALDVNLDPAAGMISADATRLQQVFWNLLTNAVKFTSPGGRVTASVRRVGEDERRGRRHRYRRGNPGRLPAIRLRAVPAGRRQACRAAMAGWDSAWPFPGSSSNCTAARFARAVTASAKARRSSVRLPRQGDSDASASTRTRRSPATNERGRTPATRHPPRWRRHSAGRRR